MRQRLYHRLEQLEEASVRVRQLQEWRDADRDQEEARNKVELFLRLMGVEQGPMESLMETWARALGITSRELEEQLKAGIDPISKYLTENGIYEAIEQRKAAGTWPGG
jgi:hypothetical protein